jgi:hypothetical protein
LDNFSATVLVLNNPGQSFGDDFHTATRQQLSNNWLNQLGNIKVDGGVATGRGSVDVATVNGVSTLNSTVQALVTVNSGQSAGVVSRYSGPGDDNMYWAGLQGVGSGEAIAEIWVYAGSKRQMLAYAIVYSNPVNQPYNQPYSGTIKLVTMGNSLKLYVNNTLIASALDSTISSAGEIGIRATAGSTIDDFLSL